MMLASVLHAHSVGGLTLLIFLAAVVVWLLTTALRRLSAALLLSLALAFQAFSGNAKYAGFPIPPDRVLLALGLVVLARDRLRARSAGDPLPEIPWGLVHLLLAIVAGWAIVSAVGASTLQTTTGLYAILDRLGIVPFALFILAPIAFPTRREREVLIRVLVVLGLYLGVTAFAETFKIHAIVFPKYILNPSIGIHYGRARGPFVEAVANGLVMFECGVAAAVGLTMWRHRAARVLAMTVIGLCGMGIGFTLTRAVWLAALAAPIAMVTYRPLRRWLVPTVVVAAAVTIIFLAAVPSLRTRVTARVNDENPVWDRYNTDLAAVRIVEAHPLTGVGWQRFIYVSGDWLRQANTYPLTGTNIEVHDVFLSHAAELGLPAALLWLIALTMAVGRGVFRRDDPEMIPWSVGLVAVASNWLIVAAFGPLSYALPNSLLWLWAGILRPPVRGSALEPSGDVGSLRALAPVADCG